MSDPERPPILTAAGTVVVREASPARRLWLAIELLLLYGCVPPAMHHVMQAERIPIFLALMPVLAVIVAVLLADPTFHLRRELRVLFSWRTLASIVAVFLAGGAAAAYFVKTQHPSWFLEFPTNRFETWKHIMLLYPFLSVAAQEIVYRTFYFHRYGPLFGRQRWVGIAVNAVLFGFAHIVMGTMVAVIVTTVGGVLLALRYAVTRSIWAVFLEHTLWGWFIFTVGLGRFFFTGVSNFR